MYFLLLLKARRLALTFILCCFGFVLAVGSVEVDDAGVQVDDGAKDSLKMDSMMDDVVMHDHMAADPAISFRARLRYRGFGCRPTMYGGLMGREEMGGYRGCGSVNFARQSGMGGLGGLGRQIDDADDQFSIHDSTMNRDDTDLLDIALPGIVADLKEMLRDAQNGGSGGRQGGRRRGGKYGGRGGYERGPDEYGYAGYKQYGGYKGYGGNEGYGGKYGGCANRAGGFGCGGYRGRGRGGYNDMY